jgi:transcriptional regulator with XRE-family HTH domain
MTESLTPEKSEARTLATFGDRILYCRKKAKLSQTELGEMFGLTQGAVGWWEKQGAQPKLEVLMPLARLFNVSIEWLLEGDGPKPEVRPVVKSTGKIEKTGSTDSLGLAGLSPLQVAAVDALLRAFQKSRIPNGKCLELLTEWETQADS